MNQMTATEKNTAAHMRMLNTKYASIADSHVHNLEDSAPVQGTNYTSMEEKLLRTASILQGYSMPSSILH
jgi:hypothetical protein